MKTVKTNEIIVSNFYNFFIVITATLVQCKNTQIFISKALFNRLLQQNKDCLIWKESVVNDFRYCDEVEKAFLFNIENNNDNKIFQMNFVEDSLDYIHLTFFATKGILYHHYLTEMKAILIINSDQ